MNKNLLIFILISLMIPVACNELENPIESQLFSTLPVIGETKEVTTILQNTAISGGDIVSAKGKVIASRGVCWDTTKTPTIKQNNVTYDGTTTGAFTSNITGLKANTTYYVRSYLTVGEPGHFEIFYGSEVSFKTLEALNPILQTEPVTEITISAAKSGGAITEDGGASISVRGICWDTLSNPTIQLLTKTSNGNGKGVFTSNLTDLSPGKNYSVRAYAINEAGKVGYGNNVNFTTETTIPTITTAPVSNITANSALSGGQPQKDGGSPIIQKGVCWSLAQNPTIDLFTKTDNGTGNSNFISNLTNLESGKLYYVRAYLKNQSGKIGYGQETSFTTQIGQPTVNTTSVSEITTSSAKSGGTIASDGGATITSKGVVWSTNSSPTVSLSNKTNDGNGTGSFTSSISNLLPNTKYYFRAYAINSSGKTGYGQEYNFTTVTGQPIVNTVNVSEVTPSSAKSGGSISSDGGANIGLKGVVWSTSPSPNSDLATRTTDGTGTASFISTLVNLQPNTKYYFRAYAINSSGQTGYGQEYNFTTGNNPPLTPSNPSPSNSSIDQAISLTLSWTCSDPDGDALTYDVYFGTSSNPTNVISTGQSTKNISRNGLANLTTYFWKVVAKDGKGGSISSPVWSFRTVPNNPPETPSNPSPLNGSIDQAISLSLSWTCSDPDGDALTYDVYFGISSNPTTAISTGQIAQNISRSGLANLTTYYWKIVAKDGKGGTISSPIWSFTTVPNNPPAEPSSPTPANSSIDRAITLTLSWSCSDPDGDALTYDVYFGTDNNPATAISTGQSAQNISRNGLANLTTYYWKIVAKDDKGGTTSSPIWSFTTVEEIITDIDGNTYHSIKIGTQVWMVENLKTTKYRNGDLISNVTDGTAWNNLTTGAYCNYNNDVNNTVTYGRLYNWYAVNDSRNIAPAGWHIPTDAEWTTLTSFVGASSGKKLKSKTGWNTGGNGTDDYGFSALPGGYRLNNGAFGNIGDYGYWLSSTENLTSYAWYRSMLYFTNNVERDYGGKWNGLSVRCIKD